MKKLINLYSEMALIRLIEERIALEYPGGEMRCPIHLSIGQEAAAVGLINHLNSKDKIYSNHRSHAHYIAKGGDVKKMILELYGKEEGCLGGRGGSMHLQDLNVNFMASIPIVSSAIALATGSSFSQKKRKSTNITVVYFGDAALEEGIFFECANFASLHNLPIIFACENNLYSVYTPLKQRQINHKFKKYADVFNIKNIVVDGNDILKVSNASKKIINYVRNNNKPFFLQMNTYRWREHCGPNYDNNLGYRSIKEFNAWKKKCPIENIKKTILNVDKKQINSIEKINQSINKRLDLIFDYSKKAKLPSFHDAKKHVYA